MIPWLELTSLDKVVIGSLLFPLCCLHVLFNDRGHALYPLLHVLQKLDD